MFAAVSSARSLLQLRGLEGSITGVMDDNWCVFVLISLHGLRMSLLRCVTAWAVVCDASTDKRREITKIVDILIDAPRLCGSQDSGTNVVNTVACRKKLHQR